MKKNFSMRTFPSSSFLTFEDTVNNFSSETQVNAKLQDSRGAASASHALIFIYSTLLYSTLLYSTLLYSASGCKARFKRDPRSLHGAAGHQKSHSEQAVLPHFS